MPYPIDETHDPTLQSWVESANDPETDFPIQNLPICAFADERYEGHQVARFGVPVGDQLLDLGAIAEPLLAGADPLFDNEDIGVMSVTWLIGEGRGAKLRRALSRLLRKDEGSLRDNAELRARAFQPLADVPLEMFFWCQGYTDFYASVYHATNVGSMFRPDNPLLPNYKWIPVGYHGRASSIVSSGTPITRPWGQQSPPEVARLAEPGAGHDSANRATSESHGSANRATGPTFAPCKMLDYELEMGVIIGRGNELGRPITMLEAEEHILGLCLLNDWSARDVQKWEYQPLGPFLAKNFATTVSPYIVTMEALAPFRIPAMERPPGDPQPLPHLDSPANRTAGGFDITLEVHLASKQMRDRGLSPVRLSKGNFRDMYWTVAQMIAHHTSNGCNLQPGDLLGSGTISGPTRDSRGCLLELTWDGDPWANPPVIKPTTARTPITLPTGETRRFLEDGDEVVIKGYCERDGFRRIGFGECRGIITPAYE